MDALRSSAAPLRNKYKEVCFELSDFQREAELERENLLNTIREGQQELGFYEELVKMVFTSSEMIKIRLHTYWCEEKEKYVIPPFLFKDKTIKFPKLSQLDGFEVVEKGKEGRTLILGGNKVKKEKVFTLMDKKSEKDSVLFPNLVENTKNTVHLARPDQEEKKVVEEVKIIKRPRRRISNLTVTGIDSPSLAARTKQKKEYLLALDNSYLIFFLIFNMNFNLVIQKFSEKYSKIDDFGTNFSRNYQTSQSFVNLQELEENLGYFLNFLHCFSIR